MTTPLIALTGGTLIDGTGAAPVTNAVVVMEDRRFVAAGPRGEVDVPEGAEVHDVSGLTVLPGFIDGHGHLEDFHGELYLHLGITSVASIELYQDGPWMRAQKEGTALGMIRGPRVWMSGQAIGGESSSVHGFGSRIERGSILTPDERSVREQITRKHALGYDVIKVNEFLDHDLLAIAVDAAHDVDLPVLCHSWDAVSSSRAGVDAIEHIWSIGYSSLPYPPSRYRLAEDRLGGVIDQELAGAFYRPEYFGPIIEAMVENDVAYTPTVSKWLRPLSRDAARFQEREQQILRDSNLPPAVRMVTEFAYTKLNEKYSPEQREQAALGHRIADEFLRGFVEAGGVLKEGSDPGRGMAGLLMHEAMAMDVEAGVDPMDVLQSVTLNAARVLRKDDDFGSVEPGKVADLALVRGNPLEDMWATQDVQQVWMGGAPVDISFTDYRNPIPSFYPHQNLPMSIEVSPNIVRQGEQGAVLEVRGGGMWPFHVVHLNGEPIPTEYVDGSTVRADLDPSMIAEAGTYLVTLKCEGETFAESHRARLVVGFADVDA